MRILSILLCLVLLSGCAYSPPETTEPPISSVPESTAAPETVPTQAPPPPETQAPDPITVLLESMTIPQRVGQLFLARCSDGQAISDIQDYHLGGLMLFARDFENETPDSLRQKLSSYQSAARVPLLLAVDEEGGTVTRISQYAAFRASRFPSPRTAYGQGGMEAALDLEGEISGFLADLGLNVNLGPVCDITTDPEGFMYRRSLGQDAGTVSAFVSSTVEIMDRYHIGSVLKHFPGYGDNGDTHTGIARDSRSLAALEETDLKPFAAGIQAGCGAVLVSHTIVEALDPEAPASLSPAVHTYLRDAMGFDGVILTDDLVMQAITDQYGAGEAAVLAVLAGNDLLCATEYAVQYEAVLAAVLEGRIDFDMLNAAVRRVLEWKQDLGLIY